METSLFIAKVFGLMYVVVLMGFILNRQNFLDVIDEFSKSKAAMFYGGVAALVTGIVIILVHNVWVADWRVLVTLIGWLGFIKGLLIIVAPNVMIKLMQAYVVKPKLLMINLVIGLVFGGTLAYFGFMCCQTCPFLK